MNLGIFSFIYCCSLCFVLLDFVLDFVLYFVLECNELSIGTDVEETENDLKECFV